jgi:hypothetical protein
MEEIPFARYFRRKPSTAIPAKNKDRRPASRSAPPELAVTAHLCEVSHLEPPQESNRNPTWFSAEKAKQRLLEGRAPAFGAELARVADRAAARIRRLHGGSSPGPGCTKAVHTNLGYARKDALQEVRFEAFEMAQAHGLARSAMYTRYIRREPADMRPSTGPSLGFSQPQLQSGNGSADAPTLQKVQFIDEVCPTGKTKAPAKSGKSRRE